MWIIVLFAAFGVGGAIGDQFDDAVEIPGSDTELGFELVDEHFGGAGSGAEGSVVIAADREVTDPSVTRGGTALLPGSDSRYM